MEEEHILFKEQLEIIWKKRWEKQWEPVVTNEEAWKITWNDVWNIFLDTLCCNTGSFDKEFFRIAWGHSWRRALIIDNGDIGKEYNSVWDDVGDEVMNIIGRDENE